MWKNGYRLYGTADSDGLLIFNNIPEKKWCLYMFLGIICFQKRSCRSQLLLWFHHHHLRLRNIYRKIFQPSLHQPRSFSGKPAPWQPAVQAQRLLVPRPGVLQTGAAWMDAARIPEVCPKGLLLPSCRHGETQQTGAKPFLPRSACLRPTSKRQRLGAVPRKTFHTLIQPGNSQKVTPAVDAH